MADKIILFGILACAVYFLYRKFFKSKGCGCGGGGCSGSGKTEGKC